LRSQTEAAPGAEYDSVILKALLVHGAEWRELSDILLAKRSDIQHIEDANARRAAEKDFLTRWLGYGVADVNRATTCAAHRATLLGIGELGEDEALVFSAPLPPGLAGTIVRRRLTITLAWMSPINPRHQRYRRAKLWLTPPQEELRIRRTNSVDHNAARRGTVQHEILEGEDAVAFSDGARFECKVNCAADAGKLDGKVRFALCVSLEVPVESGIAVYDEIRSRIAPPVPVRAS